jgi:hypothetical protein
MNDVELGPEEKSLIAAARAGCLPSEVQRARVRKGLDVKLAAGVAVPLLAGSSALAMAGKIGAGIALVVAAGAGTAYVVSGRSAPLPAQTRPKVAPAAPVAAPTPDPAPASTAEAPVVGDSRPADARPRYPARRRESSPTRAVDLAGELALLTQVNAAIKRDDIAQASDLLRSYDQRFPSGKLAEERAAAGILALCASGLTQSASAEARRFVERWPRSPLVARIKASCAAGDKSP